MSRSGNVFADGIFYSMVVAGIFVMTAPQSKGPALVQSATHGYANIAQAVTGQRLS